MINTIRLEWLSAKESRQIDLRHSETFKYKNLAITQKYNKI